MLEVTSVTVGTLTLAFLFILVSGLQYRLQARTQKHRARCKVPSLTHKCKGVKAGLHRGAFTRWPEACFPGLLSEPALEQPPPSETHHGYHCTS